MATPSNLEVWYLTDKAPESSSLILEESIRYFSSVALNTHGRDLQCVPMGDYCFDPQYGLYQKDDDGPISDNNKLVDEKNALPTASSLDKDMGTCDTEMTKFDVFCGKAKKQKYKQPKLEVWIDVSSSLSKVDPSDKTGSCFRESFVKNLQLKCSDFQVKVFEESTIKEMGMTSSLCINAGLNNEERLIKWIKNTDTKNLIVITDTFEQSRKMADFVEEVGGIIRGDNPKNLLYASGLISKVSSVAKYCK